MRQIHFGVFQERIHLETHVAVVPAGLLPDREKDLLGLQDQVVGEPPSYLLLGQSFLDKAVDEVVVAAAGNQIGHDDRIGGCPGGAGRAIATHQIGVYRVEPEFCARGKQGFYRVHYWPPGRCSRWTQLKARTTAIIHRTTERWNSSTHRAW